MGNMFSRNIIALLFFCLTTFLFGQSALEIKKRYKTADNYFSVENYISAYDRLKQLERFSYKKMNVRYMLAISEMKLKKNSQRKILLLGNL